MSSEEIERRQFLVRLWQGGAGLIAAAAAWTSWDLLQPLATSGFGGLVRTIVPEAVPEAGGVEVPAARSYLTRINGEVVEFNALIALPVQVQLPVAVPYCGRAACAAGLPEQRLASLTIFSEPRVRDVLAIQLLR